MRSTAHNIRLGVQVTALIVAAIAGLLGCRGTAPAAKSTQARAAVVKCDVALLAEVIALIEPFEGRRNRVYKDSLGHPTVGVGFNLDRGNAEATLAAVVPGVNYQSLRAGRVTLTDAQIDALLRHDAAEALASARLHVPNFDALPRQAQLIVVDMSFNLGSIAGWPDLKAALAAADFAAAAEAMADSKWRSQTGRRATHLIAAMQGLADLG